VVQVENRGTSAGTSRPTHAESPRSSSSAMTSGEDCVMPHTLAEHEYELHMPIMANPRAYFRFPNATEAYRSHRLAVSQHSGALSSALSSQSDGAHGDRVLTDDSGLQLTGSTVVYNDVSSVELTAEQLKVCSPALFWFLYELERTMFLILLVDGAHNKNDLLCCLIRSTATFGAENAGSFWLNMGHWCLKPHDSL
jgi:hypothetical protein